MNARKPRESERQGVVDRTVDEKTRPHPVGLHVRAEHDERVAGRQADHPAGVNLPRASGPRFGSRAEGVDAQQGERRESSGVRA